LGRVVTFAAVKTGILFNQVFDLTDAGQGSIVGYLHARRAVRLAR